MSENKSDANGTFILSNVKIQCQNGIENIENITKNHKVLCSDGKFHCISDVIESERMENERNEIKCG